METQLKVFLGKILGEIFRIEQKLSMTMQPGYATQPNHVIYGLIAGIEPVIDEQISVLSERYISEDQFKVMCEILDRYVTSPLTGFDQIENELEHRGVSRLTRW